MSRLKGAVAYALFSLAAGLAILACAEGALRLAGVGSGAARAGRPDWMDDEAYALFREWADGMDVELADVEELQGWRWDPVLRWALQPDLDLRLRNVFLDPSVGEAAHWRMRTNSRGFRTPEWEDARSPDRFRVVVVGDSNSMGWLLDDEETYARRLEAHLARRLGRDVEVINLGVAGYTTYSCRRVLAGLALDLEPDVVLVSCGANDGQPMATSDAAYALAHAGAMGRMRRALGRLRLVGLLSSLRATPPSKLVRRVDLDEFEENLRVMFGALRERAVHPFFLRVCCCTAGQQVGLERALEAERVDSMYVDEAFAAFERPGARERHARDLERVAAWYEDDVWRDNPWLAFLFRDRCHLNPLGADLVAEAIAERLGRRFGPALPASPAPSPRDRS